MFANMLAWYQICTPHLMKQKKTITCMLLLSMALANFSYAQTHGNNPVTPVRVGSITLNMGVGVGTQYKEAHSPFGTKVALEFGLWQAGPGVITLGGEIGGSFSNSGGHEDYTSRTTVLAARSAWHYGWRVPGLDTYAGLATGIGFHHHDYYNYEGDQDEVMPVVGIVLGASYFISPKFGFNAEVGNDITNIQAGVIFKLK